MKDPTVSSRELSSIKNSVQSALNTTKTLLENHLKHLIHILLDHRASPSPDSVAFLKKSADEINRSLASLEYLEHNGDPGPVEETMIQTADGVSVKKVLKEMICTLRQERCLDHVILIESLPSDLPPVAADPVDMEEIFYNLIVNAAQSMLEGGKLTIDAVYQIQPEHRVSISFRDTGNGIPKEAMPYIFEPFSSQLDNSGIYGHGLYTVQELTRRNGGRISVHSRLHYGTAITVSFPVDQKESSQ